MDTIKDIMRFISAGDAEFNLISVKTGKHYTYRIKESKDIPNNFFVTAYTYDEFKYIGMFFKDTFTFRKTDKSFKGKATESFAWFMRNIIDKGKLQPDVIRIEHTGQCGKCGRKLTNPTSIELGIGPYCATQL